MEMAQDLNIPKLIITGATKGKGKGNQSGEGLKRFKKELLRKTVRYCDKCGYKYTYKDVSVIKMDIHSVLFSLKCGRCGGTHAVVAQVGPSSVTVDKAEMLIDITPQELIQYFEKGPVSYKDVLKIAKRLQGRSVDTETLLG